MSKIQERLEILSVWVVKIVGAGIFLFLSRWVYMKVWEDTDGMMNHQ